MFYCDSPKSLLLLLRFRTIEKLSALKCYASSSAISIIFVNEFCLSSAVVFSSG